MSRMPQEKFRKLNDEDHYPNTVVVFRVIKQKALEP